MTDDSGYQQTIQQRAAQAEPAPTSNGQQTNQLPSPTSVGQKQPRRHALKAAAAALQTRLGHLWQQPRTRSLVLIALVVAFGLSAILWYLKYYGGGVFPEYYIAAPFLVLILLGILRMAYTPGWSRWTGFGDYGPLALDHKRSKTLWDWLRLLIIPAMLGVAALWFNSSQDTISHQIAVDQQRAITLQTYMDRMSDLLLTHNLHESKPGDEAREVARVETLAALHQLDKERRGVLVRFLYEADLINMDTGHVVVSLSGAVLSDVVLNSAALTDADLNSTVLTDADLNSAALTDADLSGADLSGALLSGADLTGADLRGADLSGADLRGAKVTSEQLAKTRSVHHTIMPNGSTHP